MKREAPAATRNLGAIVDVLVPRLRDSEGDVLEIGSGTGQHALGLAAALPGIRWWPTDPDGTQRASIAAWREESGTPNLQSPAALDAAAAWPLGSAGLPPSGLAAVWAANVVHITAPAVQAGIFRGAGAHLRPGGLLLFYGPFRWHGRHHAESNAAFDADLRCRDPAWGVRDVDELDALGAARRLARREAVTMPANNHVLVYVREGRNDDAP